MGRLVDFFGTRVIEFGILLETLQLVLNPPKLNISLAQF
jgi:hypothetical protein